MIRSLLALAAFALSAFAAEAGNATPPSFDRLGMSGETTEEVSVVAVGDMLLCRGVARAMRDHHDANYPFAALRDLLRSADLLLGNLEGPITPGAEVKTGSMVFRADPGVEAALKEAGFAVLSVANNHLPDHGAKGIADTLAALAAAGIAPVGAGADDREAARPVLMERRGIRFAFLAYNDSSVVPRRYAAAPGHAGTNIAGLASLRRAVADVRPLADVVIVSMHHGWEYRQRNPYQVKFAHAAIDAGADLVIGHHPHVVQAVERYRGKFIAYSLGNFVFDQAFSEAVREGVLLRARFTRRGLKSLQFLPLVIENQAQPRLTSDAAAVRRILGRLQMPVTPDGFVQVEGAALRP